MISNNSSWKRIFPTSAAMKSQGLYVYNELQFMIRQELSDVRMNHKKDMPQGFFSIPHYQASKFLNFFLMKTKHQNF